MVPNIWGKQYSNGCAFVIWKMLPLHKIISVVQPSKHYEQTVIMNSVVQDTMNLFYLERAYNNYRYSPLRRAWLSSQQIHKWNSDDAYNINEGNTTKNERSRIGENEIKLERRPTHKNKIKNTDWFCSTTVFSSCNIKGGIGRYNIAAAWRRLETYQHEKESNYKCHHQSDQI